MMLWFHLPCMVWSYKQCCNYKFFVAYEMKLSVALFLLALLASVLKDFTHNLYTCKKNNAKSLEDVWENCFASVWDALKIYHKSLKCWALKAVDKPCFKNMRLFWFFFFFLHFGVWKLIGQKCRPCPRVYNILISEGVGEEGKWNRDVCLCFGFCFFCTKAFPSGSPPYTVRLLA